MKINPTALNRYYQASAKNAASDSKTSLNATETTSAAKIDTVSISSAGSSHCEISKISKSIMKEISKMDEPARIDAIKKAVEDGTYQVSASAVADSILQHLFME